jgi:hypothetical protein
MQTPGVLLAAESPRAASPPPLAGPARQLPTASPGASPTGRSSGAAAAAEGNVPGGRDGDEVLLLDPHGDMLGAGALPGADYGRGQPQHASAPLKPALKAGVPPEPASHMAAAAAPGPAGWAAMQLQSQKQGQRHTLPPWQQRAEGEGPTGSGADLDVDALEAELKALMR